MCLILVAVVLAFMAVAGTAFAHTPWNGPNAGCLTVADGFWAGLPITATAMAANASNNTCGNK
jgi:hypothetical protein